MAHRNSTTCAVVIPVKAFSAAKLRLAPVLDDVTRARLARRLASVVVAAAGDLPVIVVCDDEEVAGWASAAGAAVVWAPGRGLDGAVLDGVARAAADGADRAVVAHADLPLARDLGAVVAAAEDVVLVPDRRRDGTNVAVVPTGAGFTFRYGAGSFDRHVAETGRLGLTLRVVHDPALTWDVDVPADLDHAEVTALLLRPPATCA
ncbi:MAG: 2-phospho-L-lactate guanylyltransferase [Acidimicrobiales bacterium]